MEFTVENNSLLCSFSFTEETARKIVRALSIGFYESVVTLPITVWQIIENQRQRFETNHQGRVPIRENQILNHAMGNDVALISVHHYPLFAVPQFCPCYVTAYIEITFSWERGKIPNAVFNTSESSQISSPEPDNNLLQIVSNVDNSEHSQLNIDTGSSFISNLEHFEPTQDYGSTEMFTIPSMSNRSIEQGTAGHTVFLTDEASSTTTFCVRPTEPPAIYERGYNVLIG